MFSLSFHDESDLVLQACSWSSQTTWEKVLCALLSATSPAMERVNSAARRTTAGATATPSSLSATAPTWTSKRWKRVWRGSQRHGGSSTKSLRNQVTKPCRRWELLPPPSALHGSFKCRKLKLLEYESFIQGGREWWWIQVLYLHH